MTKFKVGYDLKDVQELKDVSTTFLGAPMSQVMWFCLAVIISSVLSHLYFLFLR